MQKFKSILLTIPAASMLVLGFSSVVAYAENGSSGPSGQTTNSGSNDSGNDTGSDDTSNTNPPTSSCPTNPREERVCTFKPTSKEVEDSQDQSKEEAKQIIADLKKDHAEHTAAQRELKCKNVEKGLEQKLKNLQKHAGKTLDRLNKFYADELVYQQKNNVQVTGWSDLVAAADAAKAQATTSVAALQALDPNIDCTSPDVAQKIATFKAAVKQARDDLKAYKKTLMAIYVQLKAPTPKTDNTTGGTQ